MRDVVIVEAVRTPMGRRNGGLSGTHLVTMGAQVLKQLVVGSHPEVMLTGPIPATRWAPRARA